MNYAMVIYMMGWVCCFEAAFLSVPILTAAIYRERSGFSYLLVAGICLLLGLLAVLRKPKKRSMSARDGLVIASLGWIVLSFFGAAPFVVSGEIPSPFDAFFEAVSGFTTTGSSILTDVEAMSHAGLMWRSFMHWVGGMGVLVFILAFLPLKGGNSVYIMRAESPGPSVSKLVPKIRQTSLILYEIYFVMTVIQLVFLLAGGMSLFDSLCTAFATAGTGGFGFKNDSFAGYSPYLQWVVAVFMMLFGINFNFYYLLLQKKVREAFSLAEVRVYLLIIAVSSGIIAIGIFPDLKNAEAALRGAYFQVSSIITTTGFATLDFDRWPALARTILVTLIFIGACAGSTGGGIKVSRIMIMLKGVKRELSLIIHPRSVTKLKMDGRTLESDTVRSVNSFITIYLVIFAISVLIVSLDEKDLVTNFTAVATTLNNVGPGLSVVGPTGNFSSFSNLSKLVMSFDMLAGRLELLPMLILFVPSTWKIKLHRPLSRKR